MTQKTTNRVHGTNAGYMQHLRRKEKACDQCLVAHTQYGNERRWEKGTIPRGELKPHGTRAGYMRHWRAKEKPCDPCRLANNEWIKETRALSNATKTSE